MLCSAQICVPVVIRRAGTAGSYYLKNLLCMYIHGQVFVPLYTVTAGQYAA